MLLYAVLNDENAFCSHVVCFSRIPEIVCFIHNTTFSASNDGVGNLQHRSINSSELFDLKKLQYINVQLSSCMKYVKITT